MNRFPGNVRWLRTQEKLTQSDLAEKLGVNRSAIGAYEEGRAEPKLQVLRNIAQVFDVSIDALLYHDLSMTKEVPKADIPGDNLRILPVVIDQEGKELVQLVPEKAAAGYLSGYGDAEYIESLPHFSLPIPELNPNHSYRVFQIEGDSMLPIPSGSYIIAEYVQDWSRIKNDNCYILLTREEGIVYKRVLNELQHERKLILKSDNPTYDPYEITAENVLEVWKAVGHMGFSLPSVGDVRMFDLQKVLSVSQAISFKP
jgi:transcriptional regulator with XRE-family HTH domain